MTVEVVAPTAGSAGMNEADRSNEGGQQRSRSHPTVPEAAGQAGHDGSLAAGDAVVVRGMDPHGDPNRCPTRVQVVGVDPGLGQGAADFVPPGHCRGAERPGKVDGDGAPYRSLARINCSGGLHSMPELEGALAELRRVALPGALLTVSMFATGPRDRRARLKRRLDRFAAWHFVPLDGLGVQLGALGFKGYQSEMHGNWMGYASARLEAPV